MTTLSAQAIPSHAISSQDSWDYPVPGEREDLDSRETIPAQSPPISNGAPRQSRTQNGANDQRPVPDTLDSNHSNGKYVPHTRIVSKKYSKSSMGSDPDGFGDLYKAPSTEVRHHANDHGGKRKLSNSSKVSQTNAGPAAYDNDFWIHRDKLAQIESRELEEAGFRVPASRSGSRSASISSRNRYHEHADEHAGDAGLAVREREEKKQRRISPIPAEDETEDGPMDWELRTPEEVAAELSEFAPWGGPSYPSRVARPSTSRIPIAKISSVPMSPDVDHDSSFTRSRNGSGAGASMDDGHTFSRYGRDRSQSGGSHVLLDDETPSPPTDSPPQKKNAAASGLTPPASPPRTNKKGSVTKRGGPTNPKPRNVTNNTTRSTKPPEKRPGTSSGRPSTSHAAPEGDPPWLATMYKPDPRLPPDQQMLPTHAKRMAQERWESEGKSGSVYDRDFRLLNDVEISPPPPKPTVNTAETKAGARSGAKADSPTKSGKPEWPLAPPVRPDPRKEANGSPALPANEGHGGYKITPKLAATPFPEPPVAPVRVPDRPEDEKAGKKKSGCACCVVM